MPVRVRTRARARVRVKVQSPSLSAPTAPKAPTEPTASSSIALLTDPYTNTFTRLLHLASSISPPPSHVPPGRHQAKDGGHEQVHPAHRPRDGEGEGGGRGVCSKEAHHHESYVQACHQYECFGVTKRLEYPSRGPLYMHDVAPKYACALPTHAYTRARAFE